MEIGNNDDTYWREEYQERVEVLKQEYLLTQEELNNTPLEDMTKRNKLTSKLTNLGYRCNNVQRRLDSNKPFSPTPYLTNNEMSNIITYLLDNPTHTLDDAYLMVFETLDEVDLESEYNINRGFNQWKLMVRKHTKIKYGDGALKDKVKKHEYAKLLKITNNYTNCIKFKNGKLFHEALRIMKGAIDRSVIALFDREKTKIWEKEVSKLRAKTAAMEMSFVETLDTTGKFKHNQILAIKMYEEGFNQKDIAKECKVSDRTVRRWIVDYKEYKLSEK